MLKNTLSVLVVAVALSACVTTQGPLSSTTHGGNQNAGGQQEKAGSNDVAAGAKKLFASIETFNPFDQKGQRFRQLVNEKKYQEAYQFVIDNKGYFLGKYISNKNDTTPSQELIFIGDWSYGKIYAQASELIVTLSKITSVAEPPAWVQHSRYQESAYRLFEAYSDDPVQIITKTNIETINKLRNEFDRVAKIYTESRASVFLSTFEKVATSADLPNDYPIKPFERWEYKASNDFQKYLLSRLSSEADDAKRNQQALRLENSGLISADTKAQAVDGLAIKAAKERILKDKKIDLSELAELASLGKKYPENTELASVVKVGVVDLTATNFRDRNVFDFQIEFSRDYTLRLLDAKDDFLSGNVVDYDFIFVTDLSAAKIFREFKNKKEVGSTRKTGTRKEPNPDYVKAQSEYQQALSNMQSTQMQNAIQGAQPCYGNAIGCALVAGLRGVSDGIAQSDVKKKAEVLSKTSQFLTRDVMSPYTYQTVDANLTKAARVDYYVIDVKNKVYYTSYFDLKNHEKFSISYNLDEADSDRASILRSSHTEDDVTSWEKKPVSVSMNDLFKIENLQQANKKLFKDTAAFLKPLSTKKFANANVNYGKGDDPKTYVKGTDSVRGGNSSGTIADERFDSVVVIKNASSLGSGFYVTPDLILTAYHVVEKGNLVEIAFYDGTKSYGKVLDHDVRLDLALVKAQVAGKPVKIHSGQIKLGETVEAIGHPKGYEFTITRGVVSAIRKQSGANLKSQAPVEFVQTDTPISPGNSGGPLFLKNAVVGVNDWVRVDKASQNLNFSVSFNEIRAYLDRFEGK